MTGRQKLIVRIETLLMKLAANTGNASPDVSFSSLCPVRDMVILDPKNLTLNGEKVEGPQPITNYVLVFNPFWEKALAGWINRRGLKRVQINFKPVREAEKKDR